MAKVCILLPAHWGAMKGGAEQQADQLARYIAEHSDHEVVYLARHVPENTEGYGYEIQGFGGTSVLRHPRWGMAPDAMDLYRALTRLQPEVILHMVASAYTGVAAFYAARHRVSFIWYLASDKDVEPVPELGVGRLARIWDGWLFRAGAKRATTVIAQTARQSARMKETMGRHATLIVRNFHPEPTEAVSRRETFTVVWVANLKELKRPELFVDLARELSEESGIAFRMIGRDPGTDWSARVLTEARTLENLTVCGELSNNEVNGELACAHLLVNTSEFEGFPNTFIQAWLRGVPTLSINVDPDGLLAEHGLGVCSGSYDALRSEVRRFANDCELWAGASAAAASYAQEHFSLRNAQSVVALIDRELDGLPS